MDNKIELTPYQYASYWWVNRIKEFVEDVIKVGYSTDEGIRFTQMFDGLQQQHWRALYLKLAVLIEEEFKKSGKFIQSTKSSNNDHYVGHNKINEMLKSIIKIDIPNATLNPTGKTSIKLMVVEEKGKVEVLLTGDDGYLTNEMIVKQELNVEKDFILTGDTKFLINETTTTI